MPRTAVDYSKTVIYKIVCNDLAITDLYVGSTTDFIKRKSCHKSICNNLNSKSYNLKIYQTIRENGNWGNWSMVQIEEYPCANGNEAYARERYFYEQLNSTLNMAFPKRSEIEYYNTNKGKLLEDQKKYCKLNKDKIKEMRSKYYEKTRDAKKEKYKEYYEINKDKIKEYKSQPYICECGSKFQLIEKSRHFKSQKHINYLNSLKENI